MAATDKSEADHTTTAKVATLASRAGAAAQSTTDKLSDRLDAAEDQIEDAADDVEEELESRLDALSAQVSALTEQLEDFAADRIDDARDLAVAGIHQGGRAVRAVGRQAVAAGAAVRRDPLPVVMGLGILALLAAVVVGRLDERR